MPIFTVSEVVSRIRDLLESDPVLAGFWVRGEISNLSISAAGHLYFTLKDDTSQLRAVMFRSRAEQLSFSLANGAAVLVRGRISLYEREGNVQLYVYEMEPDGIGLQAILLRELRARLEREGLFDPQRKRPLPRFPRRVGVVTSLEGAAVRDIVKILRQRWPLAEVVIAPCTVQGDLAPEEIVAALERLNRYGAVDVIICGRGGGSFEELAAFNTEMVVRAIFASRIPVISAVGHERDETLADLVADARAATPSAAAAMVVPDQREMKDYLGSLAKRLAAGIRQRYAFSKLRFNEVSRCRLFSEPWEVICGRRAQALDGLVARLTHLVRERLQRAHAELAVLSGKLDALSPLKTLARGYSLCRHAATKALITDAARVAPGEEVEVVLHRGELLCRVEKSAAANNGN